MVLKFVASVKKHNKNIVFDVPGGEDDVTALLQCAGQHGCRTSTLSLVLDANTNLCPDQDDMDVGFVYAQKVGGQYETFYVVSPEHGSPSDQFMNSLGFLSLFKICDIAFNPATFLCSAHPHHSLDAQCTTIFQRICATFAAGHLPRDLHTTQHTLCATVFVSREPDNVFVKRIKHVDNSPAMFSQIYERVMHALAIDGE